ncbi:MAG: hypothetical protein ACRDOA_10010 [Streptosporangiaceae bacterium]
MRWLKVLAIALAVVIVFFVISSLVHILYLIGVGLLIAAALFAAFKGCDQYKRARERHEERRLARLKREPGLQRAAPGHHGGLAPDGSESSMRNMTTVALTCTVPDSWGRRAFSCSTVLAAAIACRAWFQSCSATHSSASTVSPRRPGERSASRRRNSATTASATSARPLSSLRSGSEPSSARCR